MIRSVAIALALLWTAPVVPETVELGDRGTIDLAPFACTDTPRSSVVQRVCYDEARRYLIRNIRVEQNHADHWIEWACASGLTKADLLQGFNEFVAAPSMGQFYRQNITARGDDEPFHCRADRTATN